MTTKLEEYTKQELERSIKVHENLIIFHQQVDSKKLRDLDHKSIVHAVAKARDQLKKLYEELSHR